MNALALIALVTFVQFNAHAEPLVVRVRSRANVERSAARTNTEEVGLQAKRLNDTVAATGKLGVKCPEASAAAKVPQTGAAPGTEEPRFADVAGANGKVIKVSVVSKARAKQIFDEVAGGKAMPSVGWRNTCVCKERAHMVGDDLATLMHVETGKLMAQGNTGFFTKEPFYVNLKHKNKRVAWPFHVANFLMCEDAPGKPPYRCVIDPGLFDEPVSQEKWESRMSGRQHTYVTNRFAVEPAQRDSDYQSYPNDPNAARSIPYAAGRAQSRMNDPSC